MSQSWKCLACGGQERSSFLRDHVLISASERWDFTLSVCSTCGLGQLDPRPTPAVLSSIYTSDFPVFQDDSNEVASPARRLKMKLAEWSASDGVGRRTLARALEHAGSRAIPGTASAAFKLGRQAAILDFGCGGGWWIRSLALDGFNNLTAYDVDHPGLLRVEKSGIRVIRNPEPLPPAAFDMIRLEHVLEHLVDPVGELKRIATSLRPGGKIVLTVPNFGSWSRTILGTDWAAISAPQHCNHFTPQSLEIVANQAGLMVQHRATLPIWEIAEPAIRKTPGVANRLLKLGMKRAARQVYFEWALREDCGEYLGAVLQAA